MTLPNKYIHMYIKKVQEYSNLFYEKGNPWHIGDLVSYLVDYVCHTWIAKNIK